MGVYYSVRGIFLYSGQPVQSMDLQCECTASEDIPVIQQSEEGSQGIPFKQNVDLKEGAGRCVCDFPAISSTPDE